MAYIVQRKNRFYVVDYDGIDPVTGKERRRWRLAGDTRADAESVVERLDAKRAQSQVRVSSASLGGFLTDVWLPRKRSQVRATTGYRYAWIVDRYVLPRLGAVSLRSLRADHLDDLYNHLLSSGSKHGGPLAPKTVHEAHLVVRNALDLAVRRDLVDRNVALTVHSPGVEAAAP